MSEVANRFSVKVRDLMLSLKGLYVYGGIALLVMLLLFTFIQDYFYEWYCVVNLIVGELWTILLASSMLVGEYIYRNCIWKKAALYGIISFCIINIMYEGSVIEDDYILKLRYAVLGISLFAVMVFLIKGKVFSVRSSSDSRQT